MNSQLKPGSLQLTRKGRRVRTHDSAPASDYASSDVVSEPGEITLNTEENGLTRTIGFVDTTTYRTGSGCVARIDDLDRHARKLSLVFDLDSEVKEGPGIVRSPRSLTDRYPLSNTLKIFQGDTARGVFGSLHQFLTNNVVHVIGEALFRAPSLLEQAFGRLRALALQFGTKPSVSMPKTVDFTAGINVPVAIDSNVLDAKVNAEKTINVGWFRRLNIASSKKVHLSVDVAQVRFSPLPLQQLALARSTNKREVLPPVYCPDRNFRFVNVPAENTIIEGDSTKKQERSLGLGVSLVDIGYFRDAAHNQLRGQWERFTYGVVSNFLQGKLAKRLMFPGTLRDVVAGSVSRFKRALECVRLFRRGDKFNLRCQFHNSIIPQVVNIKKGVALDVPSLLLHDLKTRRGFHSGAYL